MKSVSSWSTDYIKDMPKYLYRFSHSIKKEADLKIIKEMLCPNSKVTRITNSLNKLYNNTIKLCVSDDRKQRQIIPSTTISI